MKAFLKKAFLLLLTSSVIGGIVFAGLGFLVSSYESKPEKADVIIVLGGDDGPRVDKGGRLFNAGFAPNVVLTGIDSRYYRPSRPNWRERRLTEAGVPKKAINVDTSSETTWEEALNSVAMMKEKGWNSAIVVSDPPHMLRLHSTWKRAFKGSSKSFILVATSPEWWEPLFWWQNETSYRFVISEIKKNVYYRVVYF